MYVDSPLLIQFVNKLSSCSYLSLSEEAGREYRSQQGVAVLLGRVFSFCDQYVPGESRGNERKGTRCALSLLLAGQYQAGDCDKSQPQNKKCLAFSMGIYLLGKEQAYFCETFQFIRFPTGPGLRALIPWATSLLVLIMNLIHSRLLLPEVKLDGFTGHVCALIHLQDCVRSRNHTLKELEVGEYLYQVKIPPFLTFSLNSSFPLPQCCNLM